jgi:hypothetical protein
MRKLLYILLFVPLFAFGQLTPCEQEVANVTGALGEFVPQCEEDGSYSPMQCWASTGYCWCVDDNGVEIPGTSIQSWLGTPDCLGSTDSCEAVYIEGCMWFEFWEPVCGCDGISYSNQGEAGCYGIEDFIMGECASTILYGCTDSIACNFDVNANTDDNTCTYALLYYDCDGACINDIDEDGDCDEVDFDDEIGLNEVEDQGSRLLKMIDILGREQKEHKKGMLLFYVYDNRKIEKKVMH